MISSTAFGTKVHPFSSVSGMLMLCIAACITEVPLLVQGADAIFSIQRHMLVFLVKIFPILCTGLHRRNTLAIQDVPQNDSLCAHAIAQDPACNRHMHRSGSWADSPGSPNDRAAVGWGGQSISNAASPSSPNGFAGGRGRHARHDTQPALHQPFWLSNISLKSAWKHQACAPKHSPAFAREKCIRDCA